MKIVLDEQWAHCAAGSTLEVLEPGEDPRPAAVDPKRGAQLLADNKAHVLDEAAPAAKSQRKARG